MKNLLLVFLLTTVCLSSCKKNKDDDVPSGVVPYALVAPQCLPSRIDIDNNGDISANVYQYDAQRRVISISDPKTQQKVTYAYPGNLMVEEEWEGETRVNTTVYNLNQYGFISIATREDSTQVFYTYNAEGFLVRELEWSEAFGYEGGTSYQYSNGNKKTTYHLNVNWNTGEAEDSMLMETYFYYEDMPGKLEEVGAWIERRGRGSRNEVKSDVYAQFGSQYEYTMGTNGMPATAKLTYTSATVTLDFQWACK